ncbi:MAG: class I SAM-dependent methyltransferase [Candidatus Puniceispirillales bacterium]
MTRRTSDQANPHDGPQELIDFGQELIPATQKQQRVNDVFRSVASSYDIMNDVMSLGIHRLWKDSLINLISPQPNHRLIDLAGGTGDIAARFLSRGGGDAVICDVNPAMMRAGMDRPLMRPYQDHLQWVAGDASKLPFPDASADVITISFGLRNVTDRDAALAEAHRVLKPSGRFFCLEFSQVRKRSLSAIYALWSELLPGIGAIVAKDAASYRYLVESIKRFPNQETLAAMMGAAGFARVRHRDLSGGIAAIHCGWKEST